CPKSRQLRTANGYISSALSEVEPSSDNTWLYFFSPVRSRAIFGQQMAKILQSCPKSRYLQTGDA
ncbi:hypothetical protein, partial [Neobacillus vireti]|uniref:hypothetical protein n=1 Tax=Neobacillus vireti TaxID=220686 RepID=UPI002FFDA63E